MYFVACVVVLILASPAVALCCDLRSLQTDAAQGADCDSEPGACRWTFALGEPASRDLFAKIQDELGQCPNLINRARDQGVNHPDFYDAWVFEFPDATFSVSLKDKAALRQSFVVLRELTPR